MDMITIYKLIVGSEKSDYFSDLSRDEILSRIQSTTLPEIDNIDLKLTLTGAGFNITSKHKFFYGGFPPSVCVTLTQDATDKSKITTASSISHFYSAAYTTFITFAALMPLVMLVAEGKSTYLEILGIMIFWMSGVFAISLTAAIFFYAPFKNVLPILDEHIRHISGLNSNRGLNK